MKKILFFVTFLFLTIHVFGQKDSLFNCGTEYSNLSKEEKQILDQIESVYLTRKLTNASYDSSTIYTIPVVFHVFHLGEPVGMGSNVSEEYIQKQVKLMNDAFRTRSEYLGKSFDSRIQIILASQNPNGIKTNGINRIDGRMVGGYEANGVDYNDLSPFGVHYNLTYRYQWYTLENININVFWRITGAGAFAYYNGSLNMQLYNDTRTYVHEMGHSLNLFHTFEGDNLNSICPPNQNPLVDGDKVIDTPPHKRTQIYEPDATNPCTNEVFGNVHFNHMAYYNKSFLFSKGQIERMRTLSFEENTRKGLLESHKEIEWKTCQVNFDSTYTNFTYLNLTNFFGKNYGYIGSLGSGASPNGIVGNGPQLKKNDLIEVTSGSSTPISFSFFSSLGNYYSQGKVKIYLDSNKDGQFDENTEIIFESINNAGTVNGTINLPSNLSEFSAYDIRLVASPSPNSNSCNLVNLIIGNNSYIGNVIDFKVSIKGTGCPPISAPLLTECSISTGEFAIIKSKNCINGIVHWYSDAYKTEFLGKGMSYITASLYTNKKYFASCQILNCSSSLSEIEVKVIGDAPQFKIGSKFISQNSNTTLTVEGCPGIIAWFDKEYQGSQIGQGFIFQTPSLSINSTYFAECTLNDGTKFRNRAIGKIYVAQNGIVAKSTVNLAFCVNPTIYPVLSKSTPNHGVYSIIVIKNQIVLFEKTLYTSGSDLYLGLDQGEFPHSGEYQFYITNGKLTSNQGILNVSKSIYNVLTKNNVQTYGFTLCPGKPSLVKVNQNPKSRLILDDLGLTYSWTKDNVGITNGNINELLISSPGQYSVISSNGGCSTTNYLSVYSDTNLSNKISTDFGKEDPFCSSQNINLNSEYSTVTANYKWYKNNVLLPHTTPTIEINSGGLYKLEVLENECTISLAEKSVQFDSKINGILKKDHLFQNIYEISLLTNADRNNTLLEWYYDGNLLQTESLKDATVNSYSSLGYLRRDSGLDGLYHVILKNGNCTTKTNSIRLVSTKEIDKPIINVNSISCGTIQLFVTNASSVGKWYRNGTIIAENVSFLTITQPGTYKYELNYIDKNVSFSDEFVINNLNTFEIQSNKNNLCGVNDYLTLNTKYYLAGFSFQWKKNGIDIPYATYSSNIVRDPGTYILTATNGTCIYNSNPIEIHTNNSSIGIKSVTIANNSFSLSQPENTQKWCTNSSVHLQAINLNSNIKTGLTWYKNGVLIPNTTGLDLFVNETGGYSVSVNQVGCLGTSQSISVSYGGDTEFNLIPSSTLVIGQSAFLSVANCNGKVRWYENLKSTDPLKISSTFNTPALFENTTYYVSCEENDCISDRIPATISVCNSSLLFANTISAGVYKASNTIEANVNVPTNTIFQAAKKILLTPGFSAGSNEVFEAKIGGCEN